MNDGIAVEIIKIGENSLFEFVLRLDADVAEHGAGHLGEEAFNEIEPRTVLWREHEGEARLGLGGDPGLGLLRDMRGMVVEDQLDGGVGRIRSVKPLEETL